MNLFAIRSLGFIIRRLKTFLTILIVGSTAAIGYSQEYAIGADLSLLKSFDIIGQSFYPRWHGT